MSLRELFNAITGFYRMQEEDHKATRTIIYGAMRYGSSNIAGVWSSQASRRIAKQLFEWERAHKALTKEESKNRIGNWLKAAESKLNK